jgi:dTDP-4-dehydrorhamnose 3,5-epimerase-like enzyme|tara:strand:- start:21 stop:419 length:399 start_codon:yes stop_codon:yes gene_type:complete
MKPYKIFDFKKFKNISGELLPITFDKAFPINVKRIFFIYGKKKYKRGDHAHKKCSQVFLPLFGKVEITIQSKKIKKSICLDYKKNKAMLVPPKTWCDVKFLTKNSIVLVLCDYKYNFDDYIESYEDFVNKYQ